MGTLDWIVIGIFFLLLIGNILWVFKQKRSSWGDYFLTGRGAS